MTNVESFKTGPEWNIAEQLNTRGKVRAEWEINHLKNRSTIAKKIAESISRDVFSKFEQNLSDPFKVLPTQINCLNFSYPIGVTNSWTIRKFRDLAKEVSVKTPYKEWLETLEKENENNVELKKSLIIHNESDVDFSYFQTKIADIGKTVLDLVKISLESFKQKNSNMKYEAKWLCKENQGFFSNMTKSKTSEIQISLWIDN